MLKTSKLNIFNRVRIPENLQVCIKYESICIDFRIKEKLMFLNVRSCHQSGQLNRFYKHKQTSMKNDAITKQSNNIFIALLVLIDWPTRFKYKDVKIQYVNQNPSRESFSV